MGEDISTIMTAVTSDKPVATTPILTITNGRADVRLNRPAEHNRLTPDDLRALIEIFDRVDEDADCRVLVITGTGKSFCSGFDITALSDSKQPDAAPRDPDLFENMVNRLEAISVPTIAALNGGVYGGAIDLSLACDFRIGVEGMRLFMPAARLGIVYYEHGLSRYVTRIGLDNAKRLFLTAEAIEAAELQRIGFVTELVQPDQLAARVDQLATQIAGNAPLALAGLKRGLNDIAAGRFNADNHRAARQLAAQSEDHLEALAAWKEKRTPVFKGR